MTSRSQSKKKPGKKMVGGDRRKTARRTARAKAKKQKRDPERQAAELSQLMREARVRDLY